jgi:hypothetical protein
MSGSSPGSRGCGRRHLYGRPGSAQPKAVNGLWHDAERISPSGMVRQMRTGRTSGWLISVAGGCAAGQGRRPVRFPVKSGVYRTDTKTTSFRKTRLARAFLSYSIKSGITPGVLCGEGEKGTGVLCRKPVVGQSLRYVLGLSERSHGTGSYIASPAARRPSVA